MYGPSVILISSVVEFGNGNNFLLPSVDEIFWSSAVAEFAPADIG